ncbi:pilin [Candidatus Parcubacteria bacterium]|nr:pilin [Candidatus Parcubacteria bacterium]
MINNLAAGWANLIVCNGTKADPCTYAKLILLSQNLIQDLVIISTLLATAVFAYAGFKLLTSGGDPGALKEAKSIFMKVVIGYVWILAAWLIVYTITNALLNKGYSILGAP